MGLCSLGPGYTGVCRLAICASVNIGSTHVLRTHKSESLKTVATYVIAAIRGHRVHASTEAHTDASRVVSDGLWVSIEGRCDHIERQTGTDDFVGCFRYRIDAHACS
jgi:hypothetical protein